MTEIEKEMIAILHFRDCWEKHYNSIKNFIFEYVYNSAKWEKEFIVTNEQKIKLQDALYNLRQEAIKNLKEWRKLYLLIN